ncbi:MAG: hypothetical protein CME63_16525 [Halobacteriovoraceae bacterium]|nr:hypothetical protein [Halobacteriovoraceae bacterium]|tara:strand:+ start:1436 stop:1732 length:297 start_codon:yes stop_codon:yes gene_type:complete
MKFGLKEADFLYIQTVLKRHLPTDAKVYVFGSRARGDHQEFSDLDLMIESEEDLSQKVGMIREEFEEGSLAIKVDIIELRDFAKSYMGNYLEEKTLIS